MEFSSIPTALRCLERRLQADGAAADVVGATHMLQTVKITADSEAVRGAVAALVASPRWDCLCTGLFVACHCVELCGAGGEMHPDLFDTLCRVIERDLEHQEPRVRGLVAKVLGALCKSEGGVSVYGRFQGQLWGSVERHLGSREADTMATNYRGSEEVPLDDVTGWKSLETSLLALVAVAEACAARLEAAGQLERGLWVGVAVEAAVQHQNRYVREAGLGVARALLDACAAADLPPRLAPLVALGLADPWPQVVFSASRAARSLLANPLGAAELPAVLPRLCMNRYYVPEGVQVHSQQTWEAVFAEGGGSGRGAVAQQAAAVSAEYVEAMADPRSHFRRVAACYAVRELAAKVDASAVRPHLAPLLSAVFKCLQDNHWEVRSAACSAVGQLAQSFPEATGERAEELLGLCTANLEHESWSIREDAAVAPSVSQFASINLRPSLVSI